jgi:hypothetical protein
VTLETVVCWKWDSPGYRSTFAADAVNTLARMVRRHYPRQLRIVCVTNEPGGIEDWIDVLPDREDFASVPSPHGGRNPSCYRRLRLFHPDAAQWFGSRYVSVDLDTVIVNDLSPLWDRDEPLVFWGDTNPLPGSYYNGSMMLMTAGARPEVWTEFDPATSPQTSRQAKCFGSDQGWISYRIGPGQAKWTTTDGVYSFRNHIAQNMHKLPENARVVSFHGGTDPWAPYAQQIGWIREHYR